MNSLPLTTSPAWFPRLPEPAGRPVAKSTPDLTCRVGSQRFVLIATDSGFRLKGTDRELRKAEHGTFKLVNAATGRTQGSSLFQRFELRGAEFVDVGTPRPAVAVVFAVAVVPREPAPEPRMPTIGKRTATLRKRAESPSTVGAAS